jgi:hypothetical protein
VTGRSSNVVYTDPYVREHYNNTIICTLSTMVSRINSSSTLLIRANVNTVEEVYNLKYSVGLGLIFFICLSILSPVDKVLGNNTIYM